MLPANGQPLTLAEQIDHEALAFRARGDQIGRFLADQLDRLAQLVRWTEASTPEDYESRMEVYEQELRSRTYDRGYEDGLEAARSEYGLRHGFPLD
jgi:hypothetical protein